jgi:hypothetical protein
MADRAHVEDWASDWDFYGSQFHESAPEVWRELHGSAGLPYARLPHTNRYGGAWAAIRFAEIRPCVFATRSATRSRTPS